MFFQFCGFFGGTDGMLELRIILERNISLGKLYGSRGWFEALEGDIGDGPALPRGCGTPVGAVRSF